MTPRLSGRWFYEVATGNCGCKIITAGRTHLQVGDELYCEKHQRIIKAASVQAATLAQQDALTRVDSESPASIIANELPAKANG